MALLSIGVSTINGAGVGRQTAEIVVGEGVLVGSFVAVAATASYNDPKNLDRKSGNSKL